MEIYPRGSEWRRWDLHMHTPGTQKNDCFEGKSQNEKWDKFYTTIDEYIGLTPDADKDVVAIGITDYLSIDNYLKVRNDNRLNRNIKLVLPNVELRMMPLAKKAPINIHCIFNPDIVDELEDRFFGNLEFNYADRKYSATHSELRRLGRAISDNNNISDSDAYRCGLSQFMVDISTLKNLFNKDTNLRENTIVVVSNSTDDGVSGVSTHAEFFTKNGMLQTEATRREIYHISDLIFSANESDRKYFLGQATDDVETVIKKCGSLKGCIHGCDAHKNADIFEPSKKRYCWIKADPSFNGLKQIIYEPEMRVCISAVKPEEKPAYQVIKSIRIGDKKAQDEEILFSDKLTCIIGGKSTGKSLLLHNLALAIDPAQVSEKANITMQKNDGRQLEDVVVTWNDGTNTRDEGANERKIVYIPQTYLNRLSDENEELTEIDAIIKDVVLIAPEAKHADIKMQESLKNQKSKVEKLIYEVVNAYETIKKKKEAEAEIGSKSGIEKELKKLNTQKKKQSKDGTISDEEIVNYNSAVSEFKKRETLISLLTSDIEYIKSLDNVVVRASISHRLEDENLRLFDNLVKDVLIDAKNSWIEKQAKFIDKTEKRISTLKQEKELFNKTIALLKPRIDENESIKKISEAIQAENEKLAKVNAYEKEIEKLQNNCSFSIENLLSEFFTYHSIHEQYEDTINKKLSLNKDGLTFSVETPFRLDAFIQTIENIIDNRSLKSNRELIDVNNVTAEWITKENMKIFVEACLDSRLKFTKKKSKESALRDILADWNNTTYRVSMDGDSIDDMSPGKKALVLLKLLINLAESRCPILIDQPEDDLDNRSVFEELIPFIKTKKLQRQIIIVTHNANVVLGGDAEEIIVANQNGINTPNKSSKFEYRSGAIEEDRAIDDSCTLNARGIQQHICDILEGGEKAFDLRKHKYQI